MKETCAYIFMPYERSIMLVFRQQVWLVGTTPCAWNFGSNWPRSRKTL